MIKKICPICKKEFEVSIKYKNQIYCSRECFGKSTRKSKTLKCDYCGKEFYKSPSLRNYKKHYCSNECRYLAQKKTDEIFYENDYAYIILNKDNVIKKILFDIEDINKILIYKWHLHYRKKDKRYDVYTNGKRKRKQSNYINMARYIMDTPKDLTIDHINRNPLDNRKENLRNVPICINNLNKGNNTSGFVGITWNKSKEKWQVTIKNKFVGRYTNINDAILARTMAEIKNGYYDHLQKKV